MKHDISAVQVYGIILLLFGMAARYLVNRRRFNRGNHPVIPSYANYEQKVSLTFVEGLGKFIGLIMVLFGMYLITIEWINHRDSYKTKIEQHHPKTTQYIPKSALKNYNQ